MKKRISLITVVSAFAFVILKSDSVGPGGNYTGSAGSAARCTTGSGCHASAATAGIKLGIMLDSAGMPVTQYVGGMLYTLVITDTNTTSSNLPKHGFECSVVKGSGTSSTQAGTFSAVPTGTSLHTSSGRSIWGHNTRLIPASGTGGTGTIYIDSIKWTAPSAGSGTVTVFTVMNDVNQSPSTADAGDLWNNISMSFPERTPAGVANVVNTIGVTTFPNPCGNILNVQLTDVCYGACTIEVFDLNGKAIATQAMEESGSIRYSIINTANFIQGMYLLSVEKNGIRQVVTFVKQ